MLLAALAVALFIVIPLIAELSPVSPRYVTVDPIADSGAFRVFVADWGYHTSIIVAQPSGTQLGPPGRERAPFVEYAWGDRRFYMEGNHRPHALFAALFLPTASVTYVEGWDRAPAVDAHARALFVRNVTAAELQTLLRSLESSISRNRGGGRVNPYPTAAGYSGRFYPSPDPYLWTRDCNRWTLDRLAAAGLARGGRGVLFSGQVARHLVGFHPVIATDAHRIDE